MPPRSSERTRAVIDPPITSYRERHRHHLADRDLIDLSQAVPSYRPPPPVESAVTLAMTNPDAHRYTPDPGLPECRTAVADRLRRRHQARIDPEEVMITPGANAAFHFAANALLDPGDKAVLLSPYYFNHAMSVELLGSVVAELPWRESLPLSELERTGARVLVLVTPSNPIGRSLSTAELERTLAWARARGVTLIVDETYREFAPEGSASILSLNGWSEAAVVLGSFSKSFALTGYRVGYLCGHRQLIQQIVKVQDAAVICAPHISQIAVTAALGWDGLEPWMDERRREISERVTTFTTALEASNAPFRVEWAGAFFAWLRHAPQDKQRILGRLQAFGHYREGAPDSALVADLILHDARVLCLPGASAGALGVDRLRVAVGNAEVTRLQDAARRIARST